MTTYAISKPAFSTIPGDPLNTQMYTLGNGLRLFLSVSKDEPRVYAEIAVRAGSKHDPADTTGLAHYFEHMMFKGTDRLGSLDWPKEKALLDQIEQLFEEHRAEKDPEKKKALYGEIDRLSFEAAKYVAANEYDKLLSAIGAKGTNAYTWVEQTVYVNDIPANELERWFALESERFRRPILRLFHTELETVFEEYNISQDRDFRKTIKAIQEVLTPTHPYGTQTTLGRGEDLKNPSQTSIYRFFDRYYVPNNMAIVLCGDFDPEQTVALAERYFGHFRPKPLPPFQPEPQPELERRVRRDVYGQEAPWVEMGWRFPGAGSEEAVLLPLLSAILYNGQAGLFDLNLLQGQQVLEAYAYTQVHEDYSRLVVYGKPREGQNLEDVENLLAQQMENLRQGNFEDWLPEAATRDLKLSEVKSFEKNQGRAASLTSAYLHGVEWADMLLRWEKLERVTKADVAAFAQRHLRPDNHAAIYKHHGDDSSVMKVEKPQITPVELNRTDISEFGKAFLAQTTADIEPEFLDYKKTIKTARLAPGLNLKAVRQPESRLFRLYFIFDMGKVHDLRLAAAMGYLSYLGTSKYTPQQVQQAFYRLGVHFSATCQNDRSYLTLSGLDESLEAGLDLMWHLLTDLKPNPEALENLKADTLLRRENNKKDKNTILNKALYSYGKYGKRSPYTDKLSRDEVLALHAEDLTQLLHKLPGFRHEVFYTGQRSTRQVAAVLKNHGRTPDILHPLPPERKYRELRQERDKVFFVHFPMVQADLLLLSRGTPRFNLQEMIFSEWHNQYFGHGLSSIVFQEMRESKALAYSTYAYFANPGRRDRAHYLQAYIGTQPDKLRVAVEAFQTILNDMPVSLPQIEHARQSVLKQIAVERVRNANIYWNWRAARDRGYRHDLRQDVYETLRQATADDLIRFHEQHIKGRRYHWLVMGDESRIDLKYLRTIGKVEKLTLEDVFGY
ncbi:MAG: insulinase family protein [Saprospiraceae bacterium]